MMLGKLSVLSAAVLLAGGIGLAAAAQSGSSPSPQGAAANQGKCFDKATGQIKDKMAMANPPAKEPSGAKAPGQLTTGAAPSGQASSTTGSSAQRPAAAAGLPDC